MSQAAAKQTFGECREGLIPHSRLWGIDWSIVSVKIKKTKDRH